MKKDKQKEEKPKVKKIYSIEDELEITQDGDTVDPDNPKTPKKKG